MKSRRRRRKKKKKERKKKVGENNGQLRFVRHHMWRTQARLDQKKERKKKVGENNGQLRFVCHHVWRTQARLDQKISQVYLNIWDSDIYYMAFYVISVIRKKRFYQQAYFEIGQGEALGKSVSLHLVYPYTPPHPHKLLGHFRGT